MPALSIYFTVPTLLLAIVWISYGLSTEKNESLLRETKINTLIFVGFQACRYLASHLNTGAFDFVQDRALFTIGESAFNFCVCFVLVDLTYYWVHRLSHKSALFWSMHSVHHSSEQFNLSTALRLPWLNPFVNWIFYVPLVLIGFSPKYILLSLFLNLWFQFFIHTKSIKRLGMLDDLLNTPSNHRVHHSREHTYLDKNFGGIFVIWDQLFGTYQKEISPVLQYGVTGEQKRLSNPVAINFAPVLQYIKKGFR